MQILIFIKNKVKNKSPKQTRTYTSTNHTRRFCPTSSKARPTTSSETSSFCKRASAGLIASCRQRIACLSRIPTPSSTPNRYNPRNKKTSLNKKSTVMRWWWCRRRMNDRRNWATLLMMTMIRSAWSSPRMIMVCRRISLTSSNWVRIRRRLRVFWTSAPSAATAMHVATMMKPCSRARCPLATWGPHCILERERARIMCQIIILTKKSPSSLPLPTPPSPTLTLCQPPSANKKLEELAFRP